MKKVWILGIAVLCLTVCFVFGPLLFTAITVSIDGAGGSGAFVVRVHPNHIATVWYANRGYGIDIFGEPIKANLELQKVIYIAAMDYREIQAYIKELKEIEQQIHPPFNYLRSTATESGYVYIEIEDAYWWSPISPYKNSYFAIYQVDEISRIIVENLIDNDFFD